VSVALVAIVTVGIAVGVHRAADVPTTGTSTR